MAKKEFTYRGKTLDELKKLNVREFAKLVPSRERRTLLRQFREVEDFIARCNKKKEKGKAIRTHCRELVIVPSLIGLTIHIHNGKTFVPIRITEDMLGHRLGEFAPTRSQVKHSAAGIGATRSSKFRSVK